MQRSDYDEAVKIITALAEKSGCSVRIDTETRTTTIIGKLSIKEDFLKLLALGISTKFTGIGSVPTNSMYNKDLFGEILNALKRAIIHNTYIKTDGATETISIAIFTHADLVQSVLGVETTAEVSPRDLTLANEVQRLTGKLMSFSLKDGTQYFAGENIKFVKTSKQLNIEVWNTQEVITRLDYINELNTLADKLRYKYLGMGSKIKIPPFLVKDFTGTLGALELEEFNTFTTKNTKNIVKGATKLMKLI